MGFPVFNGFSRGVQEHKGSRTTSKLQRGNLERQFLAKKKNPDEKDLYT